MLLVIQQLQNNCYGLLDVNVQRVRYYEVSLRFTAQHRTPDMATQKACCDAGKELNYNEGYSV